MIKDKLCGLQISSSDSLHLFQNVEYLSEQPQGLNFLIMRNIGVINLKGFDNAKYLFDLSIASLFMLQNLHIENCPKLLHIIDIGDEYESKNLDAIFPNLRTLSVYNCDQLKYMIGQCPLDNKNDKEIHLHFPTLEELYLDKLPNIISICATNSLSKAWPSLKRFYIDGCSQLDNSSTTPMVILIILIISLSEKIYACLCLSVVFNCPFEHSSTCLQLIIFSSNVVCQKTLLLLK